MEQNITTLDDFLDIVKRRKWIVIWVTLGIFLTSAIVALLIPPTYRSSSTILIEEQEIPREYVKSTVTSYAEQRLQSINQRIMSSSQLMDIISRLNLYEDMRKRSTVEQAVEKMRDSIKFEMISAEVADARTGRRATIAFSIAYEGSKPDVVQQVANTLTSLYLAENLKIREQQTAGVARFIDEEMKGIQQKLAELDARIAAFKSRNQLALPEMVQSNILNLDRLDRDTDQLKDRYNTLKEKESNLEAQLAITTTDKTKELQERLSSLKMRYSDTHPDVILTKREIEEQERRSAAAAKEGTAKSGPTTPIEIHLTAQLASVRSDINSVKRQLDDVSAKRNYYAGLVSASPSVEEHYKVLLVERNNTQAKYEDLMKKSMEAKVSSGLERGQMGERFTMIDAPSLPSKPVKPNVRAILFFGFVLGIGGGIGVASLKEFSNQSARTAEALAEGTSMVVLASIPEIVSPEDIERVKQRRKAWIIGAIVVILLGLAVVHFMVMDLDVLWVRAMRRLAQ